MSRTLAVVCLLLVAGTANAKEQRVKYLVCPSHLSYCYWDWKPVEPQIRDEDALRDIQREIDRLNAETELKWQRTLGIR